MAARVAILGGGVMGIGTARSLQKKLPGISITLIAERVARDITSDGAGGFWKPFSLGETPAHLINRWGSETFAYLERLGRSCEAGKAGVSFITANQLYTTEPPEIPAWSTVVPHFRVMTPAELQSFHVEGVVAGWAFSSIVCEGRSYMPWLLAQFERDGGKVETRRVNNLAELADYDVVVNCTGLGSASLVGDDSVYPVRGQVLRVQAFHVQQYYNLDGRNYIIPNTTDIVLGGTVQPHDSDTTVRQEDTEHIIRGCSRVLPSLATAPILAKWAGLRPARPSVRLEAEELLVEEASGKVVGRRPAASGGQLPRGEAQREGGAVKVQVVHNYGHGGGGITLHWGCSQDAADLVVGILGVKPGPLLNEPC